MDQQLSDFINTLSDWGWEMDLDGIHTYSNAAVERVLGYRPEEIVGQHVSIIWPEKDRTPEMIERFNREMKDGIPWTSYRGKFQHRDGTIRIMDSSGMPIHDRGGHLIGFRGVDRDVTLQVQQEQQLRQSEEKFHRLSDELALTNDHKTLLLDIITHDLTNPAAVVRGFAELLLEDFPDDERIETIYSSSDRLLRVLAEATTLANITTGDNIDREKLDLAALIRDAAEEYRSYATAVGMTMQLDLPDKLTITANPIIAEVFKNYLDNAIKYGAAGKKLLVAARANDKGIECPVTDWGTTIPGEHQRLIFDRSQRQDNSGRRGRGLGLAIVKRIAIAHGARVGVRPNLPTGNIFYISFPL